MKRPGLAHVTALDGLRGLAVAAVLLFHGDHLRGGYLGVDLFFVLSGFLITSLLLVEVGATGRIALSSFWARRARRLLPALALMLVGVVLYTSFVAQASELQRIRGDAFATIFYVANWRDVFAHFNYWALFSAPSPLNHTWSLAIEEQFYLVWPLVFAAIVGLVARGSRRAEPRRIAVTLLRVCLTLAVVLGALGVVLYRLDGSNRVYYGTDTRAPAILLGAALAAFSILHGPDYTARGRRVLAATGWAGAGVLAVTWYGLGGSSPRLYEGGLFVCSLAGAAVIAAATQQQSGVLARLLAIRPLVLLGLISYGVYLWHWPIFLWLDARRVGWTGWPLFALQVAVTLAVSIASFVLVERPIRRGAFVAPQLRLIVPATAAVLMGAVLAVTAGYQAPFAPASASLSDSTAGAVLAANRAPAGAVRLMITGDSVANGLAREGFEVVTTTPRLVVLNGSVDGCLFPTATQVRSTLDLPHKTIDCTKGWRDAVARFRPGVVLFTPADYSLGYRVDGRWVLPCTPQFTDLFTTSLRAAIDTLARYGAHVVVATAATPAYFGVPRKLAHVTDCANALERTIVAHDPRASLVDLGRYVCARFDQCRDQLGGVKLRADGMHFRGPGARVIATWLLPQVVPGTTVRSSG